MNDGFIGADIEGTKLAYFYQAVSGPNGNQIVFVNKDLVSGISSSLVVPDNGFDPWISVDSTGRAIYSKRELGIRSLYIFDGNTEQLLASDLVENAQPNVNATGEAVYIKSLQSCASTGTRGPDCKSDVYYRDLATGQEKQVTNMPAGWFVWNAKINDAGDIVYMFADKASASSNDDNDPALSVGAAIIDVVPPTAPSNLVATPISQSQIDIAWNASMEAVALDAYDVFRNDVLIGTTSSTSFQDTGLSSSTAYTYKIEAFDLAGNRSAASAPATASTLAPPPPPAPVQQSSGGGSMSFAMIIFLMVLSLIRARPLLARKA